MEFCLLYKRFYFSKINHKEYKVKEKTMYDKALEFATEKHKGQTDKGGTDYILHPITVASFVDGEIKKVVALLHDTVEDTDARIEQIEELFGKEVAEAVSLLTKEKGKKYSEEEYTEYLSDIKKNDIARKVKIADMTHNSDLRRIKNPTEKQEQNAEKYKKGIEFLENLN